MTPNQNEPANKALEAVELAERIVLRAIHMNKMIQYARSQAWAVKMSDKHGVLPEPTFCGLNVSDLFDQYQKSIMLMETIHAAAKLSDSKMDVEITKTIKQFLDNQDAIFENQ